MWFHSIRFDSLRFPFPFPLLRQQEGTTLQNDVNYYNLRHLTAALLCSMYGSYTPDLSVVPSGVRWLSSLPSSVLCWCLTPFLTDLEAVALAACSKESLDAMQRAPYHIKSQPLWMNDEMFASHPQVKSYGSVYFSSPSQFRIGQFVELKSRLGSRLRRPWQR